MNKNMRIFRVTSIKNGASIADKCYVAESFFDRLKGLIGTKHMSNAEGLLLKPCNDIHMWFMSIPIDVVFLRRKDRHFDLYSDSEASSKLERRLKITSAVEGLKPWKLLPVRDGSAEETLELPPGTIRRCAIEAGDEVAIYAGDEVCIS
jgi:uncharacterized membrane protein (UPF0127 family)